MNSNLSKSRNGNSAQGRVRGMVLSPQGWQRFQAAKQSTESEETWGKHLTQEDLSDRTGLCLNTLYRVLKREQGVDRQSLEHLFRGFGLELTKADHTSLIASGEEPESPRASIKDDWDNAIDTSVVYGGETELAQLWQWLASERCRVVGLLGIGGIGKSMIAVKAALQMQAEFEMVIWRSLTNAPSLDELLSSLLKFLMPIYGEYPVIPITLNEKFSKLLEYLRWSKTGLGGLSRRCLLILDNAETILHSEQVGHWQSGYEDYGQLTVRFDLIKNRRCLYILKATEEGISLWNEAWFGAGNIGEILGRVIMKSITTTPLEASPPQKLINGHPLQKPLPTLFHSRLQRNFVNYINGHTDQFEAVQNIRCLVPPYSPVPDISIIAVERLPSEDRPFSGAPDWLIEIRSPDQSTLDLQNDILHCLSNGTQLAWLIDITRQQVWVWQGDDLPRIYSGVDTLPLLSVPSLTVNAVMAMTADNHAIALVE